MTLISTDKSLALDNDLIFQFSPVSYCLFCLEQTWYESRNYWIYRNIIKDQISQVVEGQERS